MASRSILEIFDQEGAEGAGKPTGTSEPILELSMDTPPSGFLDPQDSKDDEANPTNDGSGGQDYNISVEERSNL